MMQEVVRRGRQQTEAETTEYHLLEIHQLVLGVGSRADRQHSTQTRHAGLLLQDISTPYQYHIRLMMLLTCATYNNTVQYNIISLAELKFTIVTLLKKLNNYVYT